METATLQLLPFSLTYYPLRYPNINILYVKEESIRLSLISLPFSSTSLLLFNLGVSALARWMVQSQIPWHTESDRCSSWSGTQAACGTNPRRGIICGALWPEQQQCYMLWPPGPDCAKHSTCSWMYTTHRSHSSAGCSGLIYMWISVPFLIHIKCSTSNARC